MAKIWVVVADGSRARIFKTNRSAPLDELDDFLNPAARQRNRDLLSDRPGATTDRKGYALHSNNSDRDPKETEIRRFASELADRLRDARLAGEFERLFLVAPANFLGELRAQLDDGTQHAIVGELSKDLSQLKADRIRSHLPELI